MNKNLTSHADSRISGEWLGLVGFKFSGNPRQNAPGIHTDSTQNGPSERETAMAVTYQRWRQRRCHSKHGNPETRGFPLST
jgi:hypothetical protein